MSEREQQIKDKLAQMFSPTIQIKLNKDNSFSFPNLNNAQIIAIKNQIEKSPQKEIEVFAGEKKGKLRIDPSKKKFELVFP